VVGIVIVSHSATLARGVAELAREMGGDDIRIATAGGLDEPGHPLGTDAAVVVEAIESARSGDGVLVLMDLGSAVMSAEMALEMLDEADEEVLLCAAPLVEGAVAAAAQARQGATLAEVAAEAMRGIDLKAGHLAGDQTDGDGHGAQGPQPEESPGDVHEVRLRVDGPMGLHARPAARFVQTVAGFDADVAVTNATSGRGPAPGRSLSGVATLGVRSGQEIVVRARGPQAQAALEALQRLAEENFGDAPDGAPQEPRPEAQHAPAAVGALAGIAAAAGLGIGPARRLTHASVAVPDRPARAPDQEWRELRDALEKTRRELEDARSRARDDEAGIFDAQLLLLGDDALLDPIRRAVFEQAASAPAAWSRASREVEGAYARLEDPNQRERAHDVADVARRVLARLAGEDEPTAPVEIDGVLVAADVAPADVVRLDPARVEGLATAGGGPTSHAAILARAAGIPAVVGLGSELLGVQDGTMLVVDGDDGVVHIDPDAPTLRGLSARRDASRARDEAARKQAVAPAATRDGVSVEVMANAGSLADAHAALTGGADGIGLLRTEFLFLKRDAAPDEDEQYRAYDAIAQVMGQRPVVLRTLDAGADKPLAYLDHGGEANPFLGVRGIRLGLQEPALLRTQLRAALRAAMSHPIRIMFPMVSTLEELTAARALVEEATSELRAQGWEAAPPAIGVMIEVPSAALQAQLFAAEVDFFSIGTNDLAQYVMAAERGNERVARLADGLHPAVLRLIGEVGAAAEEHGIPAGVCGELAGDRLATALLIGLGITELSMAPPAVASIKAIVRELDSAAARAVARQALERDDAASVRALLRREAPADGTDVRADERGSEQPERP
jgi:multiphosphoryl transfer protein